MLLLDRDRDAVLTQNLLQERLHVVVDEGAEELLLLVQIAVAVLLASDHSLELD